MRHFPNIQVETNRASSPQARAIANDLVERDLQRPTLDAPISAEVGRTWQETVTSPRLSQSATPANLADIKHMMRTRQKRSLHFDGALFADPAWDMLLAVALAEIEQRRVSITDLCYAAVVPATTALRWIASMTGEGVLVRRPDAFDRRRVYIELSYAASLSMKFYLDDIRSDCAPTTPTT